MPMNENQNYSEWTHSGIKITMSEYGRFLATIGDEDLTADTIAEIRTKIEDTQAEMAKQRTVKMHLRVVGILCREGWNRDIKDGAIHFDVQRGIHRTSGNPLWSDVPKGHDLYWPCVVTEGAVKALERLQRAHVEMKAAEAEVKSFMYQNGTKSHLSLNAYPDAVKQVLANYEAKRGEKEKQRLGQDTCGICGESLADPTRHFNCAPKAKEA